MAFSFNTETGRRFGFRTDIIRGEDGSLALAMKPYGKIVFITSRKARVLTSNGTLNSLYAVFLIKSPVISFSALITRIHILSKSLWIWQNI